MLRYFLYFILVSLFITSSHGQVDPSDISELRKAILEKMDYYNVPSAGIAIVDSDGPVWIESLGVANREKEIPADSNTQYRIGSISKMFVALAVLKLQEEGKLDLQNKVKDLAPEIEYTNQWEDTHPIRIVHLLEHTTGWDDLHFAEYAFSDSTVRSLKEGLDHHPHSRTSRWIPGSRMSYSNSGPPVAAYIIEKITGMGFEDYVQREFFDPLGMENTTYYKTAYHDIHGAVGYAGSSPVDYWHIIMRPAGSINASPGEMAQFLQVFLNDGTVDSTQFITEESLRRMETPTSTPAAQAGMKMGYGLHNYTSQHEGFVYHGHNGGMQGALAELYYQTEIGIGHFIGINLANGTALNEISKLIKEFETENEVFPAKITPDSTIDASELEGYYLPINPRNQITYFIDRLIDGFEIFQQPDGTLKVKEYMNNNSSSFVPISSTRFLNPETGELSLVQVEDPLVGEVLHRGTQVLKPVSGFQINGTIIFILTWLLLMLVLGIISFIWFVGKSRKISSSGEKHLRLGSTFSGAIFFVCALLLIIGANDPLKLLATPSAFSILLFLFSIVYALSVAWSLYGIWKAKSNMSVVIYWSYFLLVFCHVVVVIYLASYGAIGFRSWA